MALTQRQLKEVAEEALAAARAYEELLLTLKTTLSGPFTAEAKVALLAHVTGEQPQVGTARASAAIEHISRTSRRNALRAERARRERGARCARPQQKERNND
jgi:hypothetical protein